MLFCFFGCWFTLTFMVLVFVGVLGWVTLVCDYVIKICLRGLSVGFGGVFLIFVFAFLWWALLVLLVWLFEL